MNAHQEIGEMVQLVCTVIGIGVVLTMLILGVIQTVKFVAGIEEVTIEQAE